MTLANYQGVHESESLGPGSQGSSPEPAADLSDAGGPQQGGLHQRAGAGQLGVWL